MAAALCHSYGAQYLTLDSAREQNRFLNLVGTRAAILESTYLHVGAVTSSGVSGGWTWLETGDSPAFNLRFAPGEPNGPYTELCLAVGNRLQTRAGFYDIGCSDRALRFFCQIRVDTPITTTSTSTTTTSTTPTTSSSTTSSTTSTTPTTTSTTTTPTTTTTTPTTTTTTPTTSKLDSKSILNFNCCIYYLVSNHHNPYDYNHDSHNK